MKKGLRAAEVESLIREIQRYLACVDAFRAAGHAGKRGRPEKR